VKRSGFRDSGFGFRVHLGHLLVAELAVCDFAHLRTLRAGSVFCVPCLVFRVQFLGFNVLVLGFRRHAGTRHEHPPKETPSIFGKDDLTVTSRCENALPDSLKMMSRPPRGKRPQTTPEMQLYAPRQCRPNCSSEWPPPPGGPLRFHWGRIPGGNVTIFSPENP
jgi:hypothetical protein